MRYAKDKKARAGCAHKKTHTDRFDVIIVGAGPAGLLAALTLGEELSVLLVDAGTRIEDKVCPLQTRGRCERCKPVCHVLGGIGGAQFFLGTKLSRYPAGKALLEFTDAPLELESLYDGMDEILERYGKSKREQIAPEKIQKLNAHCRDTGVKLKYYNAQKVSKQEMNTIGIRMHQELLSLGTTIKLLERVLSVEPHHNGFSVTTDKGRYLGRRVVLALGRLGARRLETIAENVGIIKNDPECREVEIGVRIETPYRVFEKIDNVHNDLKVGVQLGDQECMRTFCQDYRGYLTTCCYGHEEGSSFSSLDGYIVGTGDGDGEMSETSNLGIHHRFVTRRPVSDVYRMIAGITQRGKPLFQSMNGFMKGIADDNVSVARTIRDVRCADINQYLPGTTPDRIKAFIRILNKILPGFADGGNAVYAPSFELGTPKYRVDKYFQSNVHGAYVIGDCCGHFRGAMQAMISGRIAAQAILRTA